ncbi:hypothetical protein DDE05_13175 [Streptomyces cavourensis]|nr:hypothetical protein DDE05_13175 [Streptomyces cavourensis]
MNKAVVVGIDAYPHAPLSGCVNDAKDVASCLSLEQYDFDSLTLLNGQASRPNILKQLSTIAYGEEHHGKGSTLLFYFAGHGQVLGQAGHLVTHDAENFDPGISLLSSPRSWSPPASSSIMSYQFWTVATLAPHSPGPTAAH